MKVFISWSKNSRAIGKAVSEAVKEIFDPVVETFISQEIKAGARSLDEIDGELSDTDFGIICLTRSNQTEQWINYEAGALSRQVADKRLRLGVFLADFENMDEVNSPLNIFQCKMATLEGMTELMKSLNDLGPELKESTLNKRIAAAWPDVQKEVEAIKASPIEGPIVSPKTSDDKLDEVLGLVKAIEASLGDELLFHRRESSMSDLETQRADALKRHLKKEFITSQLSENNAELYKVGGSFPSRDALSEKLHILMNELDLLGDWGDTGVLFDDSNITIRTQRVIPRKFKDMLIKELQLSHPNHSVSFELKIGRK